MARQFPDVQFAMPSLERWHKNLLIALLVAYVVELLLALTGAPIYELVPWFNFGGAFQPWQPLSHFLVQGNSGGSVSSVVLSLVMLYFFLPMVERAVTTRQLGAAVASGAAVGIVVGLLADAAGLTAARPALGWAPLVYALPAVYGIARPNDTLLLLFFPVQARWVLWGSLGVALLLILAEHTLPTWEGLGVWLGVFGWWHGIGPGARKRQLLKKAGKVERELKIRVLEGGKGSRGQGPQRDDWVN
ncbi:MAG: hypothetical protein ABMA64_26075 [Myxococcota bacterium]